MYTPKRRRDARTHERADAGCLESRRELRCEGKKQRRIGEDCTSREVGEEVKQGLLGERKDQCFGNILLRNETALSLSLPEWITFSLIIE